MFDEINVAKCDGIVLRSWLTRYSVACGHGENIEILNTFEIAFGRSSDIEPRLASSQRPNDVLVEVGVGLISDAHETAVCRRASASFW